MPRPSLRALARGYYAGVGLLFGAVSVGGIWNAIASSTRGCQVVFSRADLWEPPTHGPIPATMPDCQQYVDILPISLGLLGALLLLAAALSFGRPDRLSRMIVGAGALIGTAASAIPMAGIWWVSDYYDSSVPGAGGLLLGALPIVIGLGAARVTWRVHHAPTAAIHAASS